MVKRRKIKKKKTKLWSKPSIYKTVDGKQVPMDSTWEVIMAMRLDELNIKWERDENMKLPYLSKAGRKRNYIPDFYLPDHDVYVEVKGFFTESAKHKMKSVLEVNDVKIIMLNSLIEIASFSEKDIK
jgi:predicted nuclease of restriction endonuclease-like RecB superfamily